MINAYRLSDEDIDELITMADGGDSAFGGNPAWRWPDSALGRAIVVLLDRVPTRPEVVVAQRRHEEKLEAQAQSAATKDASAS